MTANERKIKQLQDRGFEVFITQLRLPVEQEQICLTYAKETKAGDLSLAKHTVKERGLQLSGRGGKTEVIIALEGSEIARGTALCNVKDNFCKSTGLAIALGRALKDLEAE